MKLNKHDKHDDFCPCTRFRAQDEFCQCGAVGRAEAVEETVKEFSRRLREINRNPAPQPRERGK